MPCEMSQRCKYNTTSSASTPLPDVSCDLRNKTSCQPTETLSEARLCLESDAKIVAIRDTDVDNAVHVSDAAFDFKSVPAFFNTSVAIVHDSRTDELSAPKSTINASDAALRARAEHHTGTTNTAFCDQERMIRSENANDSFKILRSDNVSCKSFLLKRLIN